MELFILVLVFAAISILLNRRRRSASVGRRRLGWAFAMSIAIGFTLVLLPLSVYRLWFVTRVPPAPLATHELFHGVSYTREVRHDPRPLVIHIVKVDVKAVGIRFAVTAGNPTTDFDDKFQLQARTTSQFLNDYGVQLAVNGDFFWPFWSHYLLDFYPTVGDWVKVIGVGSAQGVKYSQGWGKYGTLYLSQDNQLSFDQSIGPLYNAISGISFCLRDGIIPVTEFVDPYETGQQPRTALALSQDAQTLILILVDGRQPNYSEGVSLAELGQIAKDNGGYTALNLDGGGSTTLVIEDSAGKPYVLNSPIDNYIPGRERPVANHLGIYAKPISDGVSTTSDFVTVD
jgi:hypothetical protein